MKIPFKTLALRVKGHVVGCGVQGSDCLAMDVSSSKNGRWCVNWSLYGNLGDKAFVSQLSKKTGGRHFWVSPGEVGGVQVDTVRAIEIPEGDLSRKGIVEQFFTTQIKNYFVNETIVYGGLRMRGEGTEPGGAAKTAHNVGGGAIKANVQRDYHHWYSHMGIRRPHIASTALALANAYLALYPEASRKAKPLRMIELKGRSAYRVILMHDWRYMGELLLPRMEGDDATAEVIRIRVNGWADYFRAQHPGVEEAAGATIEPLVISIDEAHKTDYEHWDLWGADAMDRIEMTQEAATPILHNRDLAPIALGMALQGGC